MKQPAFSIVRRLSWNLMAQTAIGLGLLCVGVYWATSVQFEKAQERVLAIKINKLSESSQNLLSSQDKRFFDLLVRNAERRPGTRLEILHADGSVFYRDPPTEPFSLSAHRRERSFSLPWPDDSHPPLQGKFQIDVQGDAAILRSVAMILALATLLGTLAVGISTFITVRRGLRPLRQLAAQTNRISTESLDHRLQLEAPVEELQSWIDQFNALMNRVERAYQQLESFNADVAHELRTPLSALIGQTEVSLSRSRTAAEMADTLQSNLEELGRLSGLVNDMLFLSQADRGAVARRGQPASLAAIARQVAEFHEAAAEESGVTVLVEGDAHIAVDEALFKQAVSNLVDNATRFAVRGSVVRIYFDTTGEGYVVTTVENTGVQISADNLARIFDRFFRVDAARPGAALNHGLGLAIVAAIARMHAGWAKAESEGGVTRVYFALG